MFGRRSCGTPQVYVVSDVSRNVIGNEDEGWEVVKDSQGADVNIVEGVKEKIETKAAPHGSKVSQELEEEDDDQVEWNSVPFVVAGSIVSSGKDNDHATDNASQHLERDFMHGIRMQSLPTGIDYSLIVEQGTKGYYLVKRNLKTVVLLFLLGVFCTNSVSGPPAKGESSVLSSPPNATNVDGEEKDDHALVVEQLKYQIKKIEERTRQLDRELSMLTFEKNRWRSAALTCDQDLREMTSAHSRLEEEIKQSKWLVPVAFVSPASRVNATSLAAVPYFPNDYSDDHLEIPTPEPTPAKRIPYPQLALPKPDPVYMLPMPSMKKACGKPYSAMVVAPSIALTRV